MKRIITILLLGTIFFSCSRNDDDITNNANELVLDKVHVYFTVVNLNAIINSNGNELFYYFEYDSNQRLIKKTGGFLPMSSLTRYESFTDKIYTTLLYNNNKVTVENLSSSPEFTVPKNSNYYTLNNSNQIIEKEISTTNDNYLFKKQIFNYSNNKLVEIKTIFPNMPYNSADPNDYVLTYSEKFYYDSDSNLSKTEYFEQHNGLNMGEKVVRIFENYDTSSLNPVKRLYLLDDYFYRSISKNNFRKYTEIKYNNNIETSTYITAWSFNYDANGNIILN
jgi:hypothetical protein